jgi:predicted Zn-dependent protease
MKKMKKMTILAAILGLLIMVGMPVINANSGPFDNLDLNKAKDLLDKGKSVAEAMKPWTYPEERSTGEVLAAKVAASFGGVLPDKNWNYYVNLVGRGLALYSKRPDVKYRFAVLNTDDINAYSCPGGYIFITKGLLKLMDNEAQLAGVLAHEIAHASQRHIENAVKQQKLTGIALNEGLNYAQSTGKLDAAQADMARKLGDASWDVLISKGLSQKDEYEADKLGLETSYAMGYTPEGMISMLQKLSGMEKEKKGAMKINLSTHPLPSKRVDALNKVISADGMAAGNRPDHAQRFMGFKAKYPL